ncbi:neurogenic differentiation factor 4-like [Penaeus chinensis]|uniref:neurogenic differentiation factor 4-like n=1 Tax=Penaeus chinensis TaxID=139456 RepID=UPI001FB5F2B1|nr:neurogenic differentiation factor 4-like [Penaeus chinensis]
MAKSEESVPTAESARQAVDDNNNTDNNNNTDDHQDSDAHDDVKTDAASSGKYQLRPRSVHARRLCDSDWSFGESLRHKPRAAPLSRYRRKTANARERYRMRQINTAFESLRGVLPSWVCSRRAASDMTKIATLRLASAYIRSLQDILDGSAPQDTCSWVLSTILDGPSRCPKEAQLSKTSQLAAGDSQLQSDYELATLLASSEAQLFQDNLDTFAYLSPACEGEPVALLLEPDPPTSRAWAEGHYPPTPLVT